MIEEPGIVLAVDTDGVWVATQRNHLWQLLG